MDEISAQVTSLASKAGRDEKRQIVTTLRKLAASLEDNIDTVHRYGHIELEKAMIELGLELGIFKSLASAPSYKTVAELASETGADHDLTKRVLRYLATIYAVEEVGPGEYRASNITRNLTEKLTTAALGHYYGICSSIYLSIPSYLKKNGYQNPMDETNTAFHQGWNTKKSPFEWMMTDHPEQLAHFNAYMALRRQTDLSWLAVYPVEQETASGLSPERPLYLNIGGGVGHQCIQFRERYPDLPGRVILQDLPATIEQALPAPEVEKMAYDFFQPQPVKCAKFYFMRGVSHNHPPHRVKKMLENVRDAMGTDSVLLVDETVLPTSGVGFIAAAIDMTMLGAFASMERTEAEWRDLIASAGLELIQTYNYNASENECVMDIRLPKSH